MKTKPNPLPEDRIRLHIRRVHFTTTTPEGITHHGEGDILSRTRSGLKQALRTFAATHTHVTLEEA